LTAFVFVGFAFAMSFLAWNWAVVADEPAATEARMLPIEQGHRQLLEETDAADSADEEGEEELVPISRLVPRVKTIPPGHNRVRRLPAGYQNLESWSAADYEPDEEPDEGDDDESDLPPPIPSADPPPVREKRPIGKVQLRARQRFASQAKRTKATIQPAESNADFLNENLPEPPPPPPVVELPGMTAEPIAPDDPGVVQGYMIDEGFPQDPTEYDSWSCPPQGVHDCDCWGPIKKFLYFNQTNGDIGIGHERVMFAPFEIETSQPANNFRLRVMSAFDLRTPDRAEFIWAKIGGPGPPLPERNVNYQRYDAIYEAGGKRFSFVTDIPLLNMHPEVNDTGAGIGNISLAPKMVIVDGSDWQITSIFRTYLPTGATQRGTSNGLTSLEPGVLMHYRWSPRTYVHGQLKYWIPVSGDPIASGNVFNYALGVSHVLHETDAFAIIPVLEFMGWTVAGGTATLPSGLTTSANTSFVNIQPGVRFVLGPKGDLGLCELGINGGFATNVTGWYREQFTIELRWSW
jgi:hypothetical protein